MVATRKRLLTSSTKVPTAFTTSGAGRELRAPTNSQRRSDAPYRSGPSKAWVKAKNPASDAVCRESEEDWR